MASLSAMSAGIVHEIAQPLNAIKLLADGLAYWNKRYWVFKPEQVLEKLNSISQQANRVADVIDHIRTFASASQTANFEPFPANKAVLGAMSLMGQQLANHEIIVELDQCPLEWPWMLQCSTQLAETRIVIEVVDSGRGIASENLDRVFEPFFSTKSTRDNMGLGLAIVQSVVSSFNGSVRAYTLLVRVQFLACNFPSIKPRRTP